MNAHTSVMLSASWFSPEEEAMLKQTKSALEHNKTISDLSWCLDSEGQWGETDVTEHPEVAEEIAWKSRTFLNDVTTVKSQDVICLMMCPGHEDTGAVAEAAMAYAWGKPVVMVLPDDEFDSHTTAVNLMPAMLSDVVIPLRDLAEFNFGHIRNRPYMGKVY